MKKTVICLLPLLFFLQTSPAFATTSWFACGASANINASNEWSSTPSGSSCGCTAGAYLTWNNQVAGDSFYANGCTAIAVNVDPKGTGGSAGTVTLSTRQSGSGVAGGGFTATPGSGITISANLTAGTTTCLVIGSGSSGTLTIGSVSNPVTILGSTTTSSQYGVADGTRTSGSSVVAYVGTTSTTGIIGGIAAGWQTSCTGTTNITGNAYGSSVSGSGGTGSGLTTITGAGTITTTLNGSCTGSSVGSVSAYGCYGGGYGYTVITGNLIDGTNAPAAQQLIAWQPLSPTNYMLKPYDGSYVGGTINSHAIQIVPVPTQLGGGIANNANVLNGVQYGNQTGTYIPPPPSHAESY